MVLLIATMAPPIPAESFSIIGGFLWGLALYALVCILIIGQNQLIIRNRRERSGSLLFIANIELLSALALFFFYFAGQRIVTFNQVLTPVILLSLTLYFIGLFIFHWSLFSTLRRQSFSAAPSRFHYVLRPLRFLMPFAIPFVAFSVLGDLLMLFPEDGVAWLSINGPMGWIISLGISTFFVTAMLIFFPPLLTYCWNCQPLPAGPTRERLNTWCRKAQFQHAGMLTWPVMGQHLTAAIIGVIPRFRYVMFTPALLHQLSPESLEAVLVHEIGHTRHRHLIIYPFIILGAMILVGLVTELFLPSLNGYLDLQHFHDPTGPWLSLKPVLLCLIYVVILSIYFRLVFGFFSRMFERQADLACFDVEMPPSHMKEALNEVGYLSGNIHDHPSWHHYSIRQRMQFLQKAEDNPDLVTRHHRFVRKSLLIYFTLLVFAIGVLIGVSQGQPNSVTTYLDSHLNEPKRRQIAREIAAREALQGDLILNVAALENALQMPGAVNIPGLLEVYAARQLYHVGQFIPSAQLLTHAWKVLDFKVLQPVAHKDISTLTKQLLTELHSHSEQRTELNQAFQQSQ